MRTLAILLVLLPSCGDDILPIDAIDASVPPAGGFRGTRDPVLCGNGKLDRGEACDDGYTDACGSCNAECTGAGAGYECGDGDVCPEFEYCDDGDAEECGSCNAGCSGDGTGVACS